jgi:D-arginine dehydrogenase
MKVVVVGGGIAGISIAAELSRTHNVTLLEMETTLAHHTTGRSAATFLGSYGNTNIQALTKGSFDLYTELSQEHGYPLLTPRDMVIALDPSQLGDIEAELQDNPTMTLITADELIAMAPYIKREHAGAALLETTGYDIDVAGLHQSYVRRFTKNGGIIKKSHEAIEVTTNANGTSTIRTPHETFHADLIVNATGAWGNVLASRAEVAHIPLKPLRRTMFTSKLTQPLQPGPMVVRHPEEFYFRIDHGLIMGSLADETPSPPCDAQPEELDVAMAIEAINNFTTLDIRSVESTWAGLRTFTSDKSPAMGCNTNEPHFFWLCGQGGYGIQMAPKLASLAADVINNAVKPEDAALAKQLSPQRFA